MPEFDLILFGATGFTGRLTAHYLAGAAPKGLRWAISGRNAAKLGAVAEQIAAAHDGLQVPRVVADSADPASLEALAGRTGVVATTVGPYLKYGLPLVEACAAAGVDYCDLTGEVPFIRQSIDACGDAASASGARIVHCCGYDSIPSDLGVWMVQQEMIRRGGPATSVVTYVGPSRGGASGGTIHSGLAAMSLAGEDKAVRKMMVDPYSLDPADSPRGPKDYDPRSARYEPSIEQWTAPFFMGPINTRVVRRSHALLGHPWGADFSYQELMAVGGGLKGRFRANVVTAGMGAAVVAGGTPTLRKMVTPMLPAPGEGPSEEARENGFFRHMLVAEGDQGRVLGRVIGHKDPGYAGTAIMLGEAALCLALDRERCPNRAGVLTPATAMGDALIERLRAAGMTWAVEDWPTEGVPRP